MLHDKRLKAREVGKHALSVSRVKILYDKVTLTRYTTVYFFLALVGSIILVIVQAQAYANNAEGASAVSNFVAAQGVNSTVGMSFLQEGSVMLCKRGYPGQSDAKCSVLVHQAHAMHVRDLEERADVNFRKCAISLLWLNDVLKDASREDLVTLVYHIWLFSLSVVTVLNESLPHLFAGLLARALAMGWSSFRVKGNINLRKTYYHVIADGDCQGFDPMGSWWDQNKIGAIVGLVSNVITLVAIAGLSHKLYKVYVSQTFSRVGASKEIHRVYLLVLIFSVSLQLAGFFTMAQTALWIGKISFGAIRRVAFHFNMYLAGLVVTATLELPWLVLGWISVRREAKGLFLLFGVCSLALLVMATALFASPLYRFVLTEWVFFATISGTAYGLLVLTSILAVICRFQFGKGLAHFLRVTSDLEGADFTPAYFSKGDELYEKDSKAEIPEIPTLSYNNQAPPSYQPQVSRISLFFASNEDTIKMSSAPDMYRSAMEDKEPAPIIVNPLGRTSSKSSRASSEILPPPSINNNAPSILRAVTEKMAAAEPAPPPRAALKSTSVPRAPPVGLGLPRRPSDGKLTSEGKPPGNYF